MSIPKIIHYCWFGSNPIPDDETNYIANWKNILHDYEFKLWNENNFDVNSVIYIKQAASVQKWAFVADYVKAYAVFNYGGISLDTDVEVIKKFDDLLETNCFVGFDDDLYVNPGSAFGGEKGCKIACDMMEYYENHVFIDKNGSLDLTPSPRILSNILLKYGFKQNCKYQKLSEITIYPCEYFAPILHHTGRKNITENTYSIHHFIASWLPEDEYNLRREIWDFYEKYGDDEYVVDMYNKIKKYKKMTPDNVSLKRLYKTAIKRTIKKIIKKLGFDKK